MAVCRGSIDGREPLSEALVSQELARLGRLLAERGLRRTSGRSAIYEAMLRFNDHICVEHILAAIQSRYPALRMNKTTVYRTLALLEELGLVAEMRHADGRAQYELTLHGHLLCRICGRVQDIAPSELAAIQARLGRPHGFQIEMLDQAIIGVCAACASAA